MPAREIRIERIAMGATVTVPDEVVEHNMGYLPRVLGDSLAAQVSGHVERTGLGYFPALDYFRAVDEGIDPALLMLVDEVAGFCARFSERAFRRRLSHAFSNVAILDSRPACYGLPRVRPGRGDAFDALAAHYAPRTVRLDLVLSSIERDDLSAAEALAPKKVSRWLDEVFSHMELSPGRRLEAG